jgi:hypothetical protein
MPTTNTITDKSLQDPLPQQDLHTPILRRRPRNLPHLRATLLHADVRRIHRPLLQHRSRASRGVQCCFRCRTHFLWILERQDRFRERRLDVNVVAGHDHVPDLALRQHSRRADRLCDRSRRCGRWLLLDDADCCGAHFRFCEYECYDGNDFDELDFWVFAGTSSSFSSSNSRTSVSFANRIYRGLPSQATSWKPAAEQTMALLPTGPRCTLPVLSRWLRRL